MVAVAMGHPFLQCHHWFKNGKDHCYWSTSEKMRTSRGSWVQRPLLYLGETNDSQRAGWTKMIEVFDPVAQRTQELPVYPASRPIPEHAAECVFPVLSDWMIEASARDKLPVKVRPDGGTLSEMALFEVGPALFLTAPGEVHPEVTFKLLDMMTGKYRFMLSMAEDEIGYIVPAELYNPKGIQELLSTGPDNERIVLYTAAQLLGVRSYLEPECIKGMKSRLPQ